MKIKKWDTVMVITWAAKWKTWKVLKTFPENNKVLIEWVNIKTKYTKKTPHNKWQMIKIEFPIDASNVMINDSKWKTSRVWYSIKNGKKIRIAKTTWESLDKDFVKS
jgi:large subunit ribosomal protein L24